MISFVRTIYSGILQNYGILQPHSLRTSHIEFPLGAALAVSELKSSTAAAEVQKRREIIPRVGPGI